MPIKKVSRYGDRITPKQYCVSCGHVCVYPYAHHKGGVVCSRLCFEKVVKDKSPLDDGYPDNSQDEFPKKDYI